MTKLAAFTFLAAGVALSACSPKHVAKDEAAEAKDGKAGPKVSDEPVAEAAPAERKNEPPTVEPPFTGITFMRHQVSDYGKWKAAFDADSDGLKKGGATAHWVYQDVDDPDLVMVVVGSKDVAKVASMMASPDMTRAMGAAGVVLPPEIAISGPIKHSKPPARGTEIGGHLFVTHEVEDFDRWLKAFGDRDAVRSEASIVSHGVINSTEDPNRVAIHYGYTDEAMVKAMLASEETKKAMADAGVKGEPKAFFAKQVEQELYVPTVVAR